MKTISLIFYFLFCAHLVIAQNYTVSGYITDFSNGETVIGANIYPSNNSIDKFKPKYPPTVPRKALTI